jgi:hypothetical protein
MDDNGYKPSGSYKLIIGLVLAFITIPTMLFSNRISCAVQGGEMVATALGPHKCAEKYLDANPVCTSGDQCQGACMVDTSEEINCDTKSSKCMARHLAYPMMESQLPTRGKCEATKWVAGKCNAPILIDGKLSRYPFCID